MPDEKKEQSYNEIWTHAGMEVLSKKVKDANGKVWTIEPIWGFHNKWQAEK